MDWGNLLFGFQGRINRAKWWLAVLVYFIVSIIVNIIGFATNYSTIFTILNLVVSIGMLVSGIAVGIKRLHDRNKPGWWLVIFYVVPGLLFGIGITMGIVGAVSGSSSGGGIGIILSLASLALWIWAFVELGCLRGTVGPNQYGPDPLEGRVM
jgi:uncharacterized membrane protein YhaH (DUF805 family)